MEEMQLRAVAVALRSHLPELVAGDGDVARLDADLARGLQHPPGRALAELQRVMVLEAPEPVRAWVRARMGQQPDPTRLRWHTSHDAGPGGVDAQKLTVWIEEREDDDLDPLEEGVPYVLVAMASTEGVNARYAEEVTSPADAGLHTTWVLSSTTARLARHPDDSDVQVAAVESGDRMQWQAAFPLVIPVEGDSVRRRVRLTPVAAPDARLDVVILVGEDVYRRLPVTFHVRPARPEGAEPPAAPEVVEPVSSVVVGRLPAAHTGLAPAATWQHAARQLRIDVIGQSAMATIPSMGVLAKVDWATAGDIPSRIGNVQDALKRLREAHPDYFELIDPGRLKADLPEALPERDWTAGPEPLAEYESAWAVVAASEELYDLAFYGYQLFWAVFSDKRLRDHLDMLEPGDGVELNWLTEFSAEVPHLPLPLLYLRPVNPGQEIDPMQFLGLRHRLTYNRRGSTGSRALGDWLHTTRAHLLYWGNGPDDPVGVEAARHTDELRQWQPLLLLPRSEPRIEDLARFLSSPDPSPVSLLYFYCHCSDESGRNPFLRFGPTNDAHSVLRRPRMGSDPLPGEPIVFVNACGSSESDPLLINQLMDAFLDRGCRGYIGTEGQVPPGLAARFATTFFSFLYGTPARTRAPVGEAVAQARRSLWLRYRNLGGLFYNYVNDFLIYAADDEEVGRLRSAVATEAGATQ